MVKENEDLKPLLKKVVLKAQTLAASKKNLKGFLEGTFNSPKKLQGEFSIIKGKFVETYDHYFEQGNSK